MQIECVQRSRDDYASTWLTLNALFVLIFLKRARVAVIASMLLAIWGITGVIYGMYCQLEIAVYRETVEHCNNLCAVIVGGFLVSCWIIDSLVRRRPR